MNTADFKYNFIQGGEGVGKTTLLLEIAKKKIDEGLRGIYLTYDLPLLYRNTPQILKTFEGEPYIVADDIKNGHNCAVTRLDTHGILMARPIQHYGFTYKNLGFVLIDDLCNIPNNVGHMIMDKLNDILYKNTQIFFASVPTAKYTATGGVNWVYEYFNPDYQSENPAVNEFKTQLNIIKIPQ